MASTRYSLTSVISKLAQNILNPSTTSTTSLARSQSWAYNPLSTSIAIPAISINLPGLFSDIWDGLLKAVPKKKTSHMKKRHRQLAGKALKDVNAVVTCPGCGKPKRAHLLCPYCVAEIQHSWKSAAKKAAKSVTDGGSTS